MTKQDLFAYQDTMAAATTDIHKTCAGLDITVLWDDGRLGMVTGRHKVRIWNNLGSVELRIDHDDVLERGNAYKGFLALLTSKIQKGLSL